MIIYRLPIEKSIIKPSSYCFKCLKPIKFYDNIPLLSYLVLGGKCRHCQTSFSSRYFWVELLTGFLYVICFVMNHYEINIFLLKNILFISYGVIIFFIDIDHKLILDKISIPLIFLGILFALLGTITIKSSLLGAISGFMLFYLIRWVYLKSKGIEGLGGGDVKYIAAVGAFLGISGMLFVIFFSSFFAIILSIIFRRRTINQEFPFGPYLVFASFTYLLFGEALVRWYLNLFFSFV